MPELEQDGVVQDVLPLEIEETDAFLPGLMAGVVSTVLLGFIILGSIVGYHPQKHTGAVQVTGGNSYTGYIFKRPNNEVFKAKFDDNELQFQCGTKLYDITYVDTDKKDVSHFIKAQLQ